MIKTALIILANGFEEIEAITPIDILRRGGVEVTVAGLDSIQAEGAHGIHLTCDCALTAVMNRIFSAVVLPGGMPGSENLSRSPLVRQICKEHAGRGDIVAAICAAPALALGSFGLLSGRRATCFPACSGSLPKDCHYRKDQEVVIDGNIITSQGAGTSFAFGLALLQELSSPATSEEMAGRMLYRR